MERIPVVKELFFLKGREAYPASGGSLPLSGPEAGLLRSVLSGDIAGSRDGNALRSLCAKGLAGTVRWPLATRWDVVIVSHGWGGCHVFAVDLWQKLNESCRALLVAPSAPYYGYDGSLEDRLVTVKTLFRLGMPVQEVKLSYVSFLRALLHRVDARLLFLAHRSCGMYLADIVRRIPAIIHSDGYNDEFYALARGLGNGPGDPERLHEMYFAVKNGTDTPHASAVSLREGWKAMLRARENWCYSLPEYERMKNVYPELAGKLHFVPPFIDTERFSPAETAVRDRVLFVTSMQETELKGMGEMLAVMKLLPARIKATLTGKYVGACPAPRGRRVELVSTPKDGMKALYDRSFVYCRPSRKDSTPYSMLEAMACGLPVIVSPGIAATVPAFKDGVTGFAVEPGDVRALARRIELLYRDPELRGRMGGESARRVQEYSFARNLDRVTRYLR